MQVLLVTTDFPPTRGGIQTLLKEFCLRSRFDVSVIACRDPGYSEFDHGFKRPVRRVGSFAGLHSRRAFVPGLTLRTLRSAFATRPDVVFAGHVLAGFGGVLLRNTPLVVGTYGVELIAPRARKAAAYVLPRADRTFAVSHFTADAARSLGARNVEVIPVGAPEPKTVDPAFRDSFIERFALSGARVILTVARLEAHKGIDVVIKALRGLPNDVRYLVVGSGPHRKEFEHVAQREGVSDRVIFAGALSDEDLAAAYRTADAFVLASRSLKGGQEGVEGCPVSLLEASAYGLPIVAANTGGITDAIQDGVTGRLVNPENINEVRAALADALDGKLASQAKNAARLASTDRSWSNVIARIDDLLQNAARDT
ncbi:MAG: glycosyltransferase family 4 protein [Actinomycetota bacterium]